MQTIYLDATTSYSLKSYSIGKVLQARPLALGATRRLGGAPSRLCRSIQIPLSAVVPRFYTVSIPSTTPEPIAMDGINRIERLYLMASGQWGNVDENKIHGSNFDVEMMKAIEDILNDGF